MTAKNPPAKKPAPKKKPAPRKPKTVPVTGATCRCATCIYHVPWEVDKTMGRCHRYPQTIKSQLDHWCGEYKVKS